MNDNNDFATPSLSETLITLAVSGLTIAALLLAGYYTPSLLAFAVR